MAATSRSATPERGRPRGGADRPDASLEARLRALGYAPVAGVDEAGRGALAGPVVAAAVILPDGEWPFRDSKTLSAGRRAELAERVKRDAIAWAIGSASAAEIDRLDVLRATLLAAERAVAALRPAPAGLVTDHLRLPGRACLAVARADARSWQAAAASLLAKTARDAMMAAADRRWPGYGFAAHKGYGAPAHLRALHELGPCPWHRRTFRPVAQGTLFVP